MFIIQTALLPEAKPLIRQLKLKLLQDSPYRIYGNEKVRLIISGIGGINTVGAISFISGRHSKVTGFFNVGYAGHKSEPLGKTFFIHQITQEKTGKTHYPHISTDRETAPLITLDAPSTHYQDALFDMEGFYFFQTAKRFTFIENIHLMKIVSDNNKEPFDRKREFDYDVKEVLNRYV